MDEFSEYYETGAGNDKTNYKIDLDEIRAKLPLELPQETRTMMSYYGGRRYLQTTIGGESQHFNQSNIINWTLFKQLQVQKYDEKQLIQTINDILQLDPKITDTAKLSQVIDEIYQSSPNDLLQIMTREANLDQSAQTAIERLFFVWLDLCNVLAHITITEYNAAMAKVKGKKIEIPKNKIKELEQSSSSPIMTLIADQTIKFEQNDHFSPDLNKNIARFNEKIAGYIYRGYCPREPKVRLRHLLAFPVEYLYTIAKELNATYFVEIDLYDVFKEIAEVELPDEEPLKIELNRQPTANLQDKMDKLMDLYQQMQPIIEAREEYFITIADKLSTVCGKVDKIIKKLKI